MATDGVAAAELVAGDRSSYGGRRWAEREEGGGGGVRLRGRPEVVRVLGQHPHPTPHVLPLRRPPLEAKVLPPLHHPDCVVEPISFNSSSQASRPSSTPSSSSSPTQQTRVQNSGSTGGKSAQAGTNVHSVCWVRQTIQFSVNAWVFVVAVLATFLLVPRNLSHQAYRLSFLVDDRNQADGIFKLFKPGSMALIPVVCQSVEVIAKFLRRNCTNSSIYRWQRNVIQTIMYWQLLKLTYFAPVTAGDHQSVWAKIGRSVNPLIHRYASFLNTPLAAVQKWWLG